MRTKTLKTRTKEKQWKEWEILVWKREDLGQKSSSI